MEDKYNNKTMKTFKDFMTKKPILLNNEKIGEVGCSMEDVFGMLNYLSREIQSVKDNKILDEDYAEMREEKRKERALIKMCLDYSWHRLVKHDHCGLGGKVDIKLLEKLRKELS